MTNNNVDKRFTVISEDTLNTDKKLQVRVKGRCKNILSKLVTRFKKELKASELDFDDFSKEFNTVIEGEVGKLLSSGNGIVENGFSVLIIPISQYNFYSMSYQKSAFFSPVFQRPGRLSKYRIMVRVK